MTRTVNIEVYAETNGEVFGVVSEHRPDLPNPLDKQLQEWVKNNFTDLEQGENRLEAGELEYEPNGEIIEFRKK